MSAPRRYLVPKALTASGLGQQATLDEMEYFVHHNTPVGEWARRVLVRENSRVLDELLGEATKLPRGVLASSVDTGGVDVVTGLINEQGEVWTASGWHIEPLSDQIETCDLDDNDVAFVVRAIREGASGVVMRAGLPLAFLSAAAPSPSEAPPEDAVDSASVDTVPDGAKVVAIVDPIDKDAVLEALAIAPGPKVYRRHDGKWVEDAKWIGVLSSVRPPTMVKLDEALTASVTAQVDQATAGQKFRPFEDDDAKMYQSLSASSYVQELRDESDTIGVEHNLALVAVAGRELSPKDFASTEKLRHYWLYGEGAAKIRWFTPGSWRRCYRHLVKYVGPRMAPGYCTNLSQRLGGHGVATHVGD